MGYGGKLAARTGDVRRFNFTGNGSNTAFDLGFAPATQNQLIVTINGVVQHYDAFSVTGSTLTFTGTPSAGDYIQVTAVVDAIGVMGIADGAVANVSTLRVTTTPMLVGNAVGTFSNPLIQAASTANSWVQINAQNLNNGNNASTDLILARSDGNDSAGYIDVGVNSNTYSQAAYSIMTPNSGYMFTNGGDLFIGTQTAHAVAFHTGNTTSASERMRIAANGMVGIGKVPSVQLDIQGTAAITNNGTGVLLNLNDTLYNNFQMGTSSDKTYLGTTSNTAISFNTYNAERMRIAANGYVGVGITSPVEKLHLGGKLLVQNDSQSGTYTISYWFPSGTTTSICTLSSYGQDTVAVASIDWASLYNYAGANFGIGHGIAGTRRSTNNTVWTNNAIYTLNNGDTGNAPTFTWNNGVLQMTTAGSVQITATIRIAVHGATLTFNI
jgi:hypothetical protein